MNIVHFQVVLPNIRGPWIVHNKSCPLFAKEAIESSELNNGIKKDDNLWFKLYLRNPL